MVNFPDVPVIVKGTDDPEPEIDALYGSGSGGTAGVDPSVVFCMVANMLVAPDELTVTTLLRAVQLPDTGFALVASGGSPTGGAT